MEDMPRVMLTVGEAADALCVSRTTIFALIKADAVESVKIGRSRYLPADAIMAYVSEHTDQPSSQEGA